MAESCLILTGTNAKTYVPRWTRPTIDGLFERADNSPGPVVRRSAMKCGWTVKLNTNKNVFKLLAVNIRTFYVVSFCIVGTYCQYILLDF